MILLWQAPGNTQWRVVCCCSCSQLLGTTFHPNMLVGLRVGMPLFLMAVTWALTEKACKDRTLSCAVPAVGTGMGGVAEGGSKGDFKPLLSFSYSGAGSA